MAVEGDIRLDDVGAIFNRNATALYAPSSHLTAVLGLFTSFDSSGVRDVAELSRAQ